jgi:TonB family protein
MLKDIKHFQFSCIRELIYAGIFIAAIFFIDQDEVFAQEMHALNASPAYPGGKIALKEFITTNLRYPEAAKKNGISGVVEIKFMINKEGNVENISVMKGISKECDAEAIRLISLIKGWTPGMRQGKQINTLVCMPIEFKGVKKLPPSFITGKITDRNSGLPVEGALIIIKGTNIGSVTGPDGSYRLEVPDDSKYLQYSATGYSAKEVAIDYHSTINIEMDIEYLIIDFNTKEN